MNTKFIFIICLLVPVTCLGQRLKKYYLTMFRMHISLPVTGFKKNRINIIDTNSDKYFSHLENCYELSHSGKKVIENIKNPSADLFYFKLLYLRQPLSFDNDSCLLEYDFRIDKFVDKSETKKMYINKYGISYTYYFYESHNGLYEGHADYEHMISDDYKIHIFFNDVKTGKSFCFQYEFSKQYKEYGKKLALRVLDSIHFD